MAQVGEDDDKGPLLIAIFKEDKTLINPTYYRIQEGDQGLVIADSIEDLQEVYALIRDEESQGYKTYKQNIRIFEMFIDDVAMSICNPEPEYQGEKGLD